jgi:electron transport complex protein RnfC
MKKATQNMSGVEVRSLPSLYPQGGEKVLVYHTLGRVIKEGQLPLDCGVIVVNCTTAACIAKYINTGMPLVEKCVTVNGSAIAKPQNVIAPIGTSIADLVEFCGGTKEPPVKVLSGGTMMGFAVSSLDIATTKTTSGLLLLSKRRVFQYTSEACINCGRCLRACPMNLNPADISKAVEADDIADAERAHVMTCIECGACSFVCPAHRTITQFCRRAKNSIRARIAAEKAKAAAAAAKGK